MIKLEKFPIPDQPIDFVQYYKDTYGIDVNKAPMEVQCFLALAREYGASQALMMTIQKLQVEQTAQEA